MTEGTKNPATGHDGKSVNRVLRQLDDRFESSPLLLRSKECLVVGCLCNLFQCKLLGLNMFEAGPTPSSGIALADKDDQGLRGLWCQVTHCLQWRYHVVLMYVLRHRDRYIHQDTMHMQCRCRCALFV